MEFKEDPARKFAADQALSNFTDYLVDIETSRSPEGLDSILQQMGAALVGGGMPGGYVKHDGHYVARYLGSNPEYFEFACEHQGYCKIVGKLERPL